MNTNFKFWGIDGCKDGWFCIGLDTKSSHSSFVAPTITEAYAGLQKRGAKIALIDIPIGLSSTKEERICDKQARQFVGKRKSSVFPVPCRQAIEGFSVHDKDAAKAVNIKITGRSLSVQTLAIMDKIAEVDSFMLDHRAKNILREVHPEVCFCALNGKTPLLHSKKSRAGEGERLRILKPHVPHVESICDEARAKHRGAKYDDIVDALAAAITAKIGYPNKYHTLPATPQQDSQGLKMEMVYALFGVPN